MPNGAPGNGPKLPSSALPEMICSSDLAAINKALASLFADLRHASQLYADNDSSDRAATLVALNASWRFLIQFQVASDEQLHLPLLNLSSALMALDNNDVARVLRPTPTPKGGRAFDAPDRQALIGIAVGTVGRLCWTGMPVREAQKVVAAELAKLGIRSSRGANGVTARTVKQWCERVSAAQPLTRTLLVGGPEALANARQTDIAQIAAVQNLEEMLSSKWRSLLHRQPRDAARAFILDSLRTSIRKRVAGGNTPLSAEKPAKPPLRRG